MAIKFTFLFLNLAKIHIFISNSAYGGGEANIHDIILSKIIMKRRIILDRW